MITASLCLLAGTALASGDLSTGVVGEVSLVLGRAYILRSGEARELISAGTAIRVNDRIETETNGHVHIRFIDQALVSVRPSSTLEIVRYDYRPEAPQESVVKLNLVDGVTRAISGKAAKAARGNFRMNTPIAAIGVRGTDFVVRADQNSVRAQVNEGAIIVAPFSSQCSVDALGPCSQNALELVGGASQILQMSANMLAPVLLPMQAGIPQTALAQQSEVPGPVVVAKGEREENSSGGLYTASVTSRVVNEKIATTKASNGPDINPPVGNVDPDPPVIVPEFTPDVPVATVALYDSQLVWGRYSDARIQNERITALYDATNPTNMGGRSGTVGNNAYALFRPEPGSLVVQPGLSVVGFDLVKAQAFYNTQGSSELMDVFGGTLSIDFNENRYSTNLSLGHSATGHVEFNDSGRIFAGGYFHDVRGSDPETLAGAVSLDGAEAGYFFEKTLDTGTIEGLTLWGRQP